MNDDLTLAERFELYADESDYLTPYECPECRCWITCAEDHHPNCLNEEWE